MLSFRSLLVIPVALLTSCVLGGFVPGTALGAKATLVIKPHCMVGKPAEKLRFAMTGLKAKERVTFSEAPRHERIGGGSIGRYRANTSGVLRFTYPAPTGKGWKPDTWTVTAYALKHVIAHATYQVIRSGQTCS